MTVKFAAETAPPCLGRQWTVSNTHTRQRLVHSSNCILILHFDIVIAHIIIQHQVATRANGDPAVDPASMFGWKAQPSSRTYVFINMASRNAAMLQRLAYWVTHDYFSSAAN
jgi:hypothetical protein